MAAEIRFVIIANPRTGSNHFIDLLNSHQDVTCQREAFHPDAVYLSEGTRDDLLTKRNRDPIAFLREMYESSPTRACGFKIFMGHNSLVLDTVLRDPAIKKLVLYRPNFLAVYSSEKIAELEKQYVIVGEEKAVADVKELDASRTSKKATFVQEDFARRQNLYLDHYKHVVRSLNESGQEYLFFTYEEIVNESLFRRVFPFIGLAQPEKLESQIRKMNTSDILSRFTNPEDALGYIQQIGCPHWAREGFSLWSEQKNEGGAPACESITRNFVSGPNIRLDLGSEEGKALLFVDYAVPFYDKFAGSRTNFMYLQLLVRLGLKVQFFPADFKRVEPYSTELRELGIEVLGGEWFRDNWQSWIKEHGPTIDYVFFNKPEPTRKFLQAVKDFSSAAILYQCHDLHYLRLRRKGEIDGDEAVLSEAGESEKLEHHIFENSDVILTFSAIEKSIIAKDFPQKKVFTVPLYFYDSVPTGGRRFCDRRDLLFVGSCSHAPNRDAIAWFCNEIFPLVRKKNADVSLYVVGSNPTKDILALQSDSIRVTGAISDAALTKLYDSVRLSVVPVRFGAGLKGKTIEALYHGVPVVSSSIGLEGLVGIEDIATPQDDAGGFAAEILSLYNDETKWNEVTKKCTDFCARTLTWGKAEDQIREVLSHASTEAEKRPANGAQPRLIAFYLPQFHPIPENDVWWGSGFTEWRNVGKADPLFPGHYQPHIPADLGFYDLRLPETRTAQAELAREHGVYGFCYYHYWFKGRRLLERPVEHMYASGSPDFPYCFCWANENWTRRWDGEQQLILLEQTYSEEDDRIHIRDLFRFFRDARYIRVNGKPLFLVYRTENMPDPGRTAAIWRNEARQAGIGELYLVRVESIGKCDPTSINFDAAVEFAPDWSNRGPRLATYPSQGQKASEQRAKYDPVFRNNDIHTYDGLVEAALAKPTPDYKWIRCVTPSWDNTARRQDGACVFVGASPERYGNWLATTIQTSKERLFGDERIVFINGWNEWAEGNHLEPDIKFGRRFLEATRAALAGEDLLPAVEP